MGWPVAESGSEDRPGPPTGVRRDGLPRQPLAGIEGEGGPIEGSKPGAAGGPRPAGAGGGLNSPAPDAYTRLLADGSAIAPELRRRS